LVENFDIKPIGDVEADVRDIVGGPLADAKSV